MLFGSGCTSFREYVANGYKVGPNYRRPPAPVANDWIDADDMRLRKEESPELARWWTVFQDPVLDQLVADSYRQNLTLREAGFRILQNRALLGIAVGGFFPQQQYAFGDHTANSISKNVANRGFVLEQFYPQYDIGFTLNWELDFWGRFRRAIIAANDRLDASVEDFDAVLVTMLGDIAQAYVQIRIYEQQIALTRANVELQRETLAIATARYKGGLVTELDVDQAQSILSETEAQIPQLEISLRQTNNRLCVLLGIPAEDLERRIAAPRHSQCRSRGGSGHTGRPGAAPAGRAPCRADRGGASRADRYRRVGFLSGPFAERLVQLLGGGIPTAIQPRGLYGTWGPAFQWNLLNYGRHLKQRPAQDALFQELVAHYQNTVLTASQEVENGIVVFLKSQVQTRLHGRKRYRGQESRRGRHRAISWRTH